MSKSKLTELILKVVDTMQDEGIPEKVREEMDDLRKELIGMVNPQAPGWGVWESDPRPTEDPGMGGWMQCIRIPSVIVDREVEVVFYKGIVDGKPVIQIEGEGDFRINVNDAIVWDADPVDHHHEFCSCTKKE